MIKRKFLLKRDKLDERDRRVSFLPPSTKLPKVVDLTGDCPPVFDQGELGSCTANAGVACHMMVTGTTTPLSRLFLYYSERLIEGTLDEDAGAEMRDIGKADHDYGICREKYYPYIEKRFSKEPGMDAHLDALDNRIGSYSRLGCLTQIRQHLGLNEEPVLLGMDVYPYMMTAEMARRGILKLPKTGEQSLGGHAVLCVGYSDNGKFLIIRNSWGSEWGMKGYFRMPYMYVERGYAFDFWTLAK